MNIVFSENFKNLFTEMYEYNIKYSIGYANRLRLSMLKSIERLKETPYIGNNLPDKKKEYKELICQKYRIIYRVSEIHNLIYIDYIVYAGKNFRALFKIYNKKTKVPIV